MLGRHYRIAAEAKGRTMLRIISNLYRLALRARTTPNRMDAMSHLGVAVPVLCYLNHGNIIILLLSPFKNGFKAVIMKCR